MSPRSITIRYGSRRSEVWTHYWQLWRQKLWRAHAALFTAVVLVLLAGLSGGHLPVVDTVTIALVGGLLPCVGLAFYPLAKFKPQERVLTINGQGLSTSIGQQYGEVAWREIEAITDHEGLIIIRRTNGNAFVVPDRAFVSLSDRAEFLNVARNAWATVKP